MSYSAAWVPDDDPHRDWEEATALASEWLLGQADDLGLEPLLVTHTQDAWSYGDAISDFARRYEATTPRSRTRVARGKRAVLAYVPDYDLASLAISFARAGALAIVESESTPLLGWAAEAGAVNLITGEPTPDERSSDVLKEYKSILFYGNNGWTRGFGADSARRILQTLSDSGRLDRDLILGYALAHGKNGDALKRLDALMDKIQ